MSYGTNAPWGLQPRCYQNGSPWNNQTTEYQLADNYGTALFTGDPVMYLENGTIGIATAGANPIIGVFFGVKYVDTSGTVQYSPYWAANTRTLGSKNAQALVVDDPNVLFDIQADSSLANGIAAVDLFQNGSIVFGTPGSTRTGQSGATIGALNTTADLQLKIIRFVQTTNPGQQPGVAFNNVLVMLNNDPYKGGTGTLGV